MMRPPPRSTLFPDTPLFRSRVVLYNLLGNAFKFSSRQPAPRVSFELAPSSMGEQVFAARDNGEGDRKSTRLNSSHANISYAVFCLKKKKNLRVENTQKVKKT